MSTEPTARREDDTDVNAAFLEAVRTTRERTQRASIIYDALVNTGRLHEAGLRVTTYRCPERCTLLDLVDSPEGLLVGFPRYKTSPSTTEETSNASGRRKNTEDGWRRWGRHAAFVESVSNVPLSCDHLRMVPLTDDAVRADLAAGHVEVIVRGDGSRYATRTAGTGGIR